MVCQLWRRPSGFSTAVFSVFGLLLLLIGCEVAWFIAGTPIVEEKATIFTAKWGITWAVLIAVSGFIRNLLVQYLGDVAIYIQPHALDRFYELRGRIKKLARETVHPVYAIKDANGRFAYDSIYWIGHSLGSVVA